MNKTINILVCLVFTGMLFSCGPSLKELKKDFKINSNTRNKTNDIAVKETLKISLNNTKNHDISSVTYQLNDKIIPQNHSLINEKLGPHTLKAIIKKDEDSIVIKKQITILNDATPKIYTFSIVNTYPHDITSYTQGLEFYKGNLYESTGQYQESKLRQLNYKECTIITNKNLDAQYFGEGITILDDKIYQLTWREKTGFIYDINTFKKTSSFNYGQSKEGWGLCNDGKKLYKSDGTEKIWILNSETLAEEQFISVYTNRKKIPSLNELEWVNGKIFANIYQANGVAIINPKNGAVEGLIDFSSLKDKVTQHTKLDVLNGIAYNKTTDTFFVTGKNWDKIFEVKIEL
mgnify:CR=1 FL=1